MSGTQELSCPLHVGPSLCHRVTCHLLATALPTLLGCATKQGRNSSPSKFLSPGFCIYAAPWQDAENGFCIADALKISTEDRNIKTYKKNDIQYGLEQQNYPLCSLVKCSKNTYMCAGKEGDWV